MEEEEEEERMEDSDSEENSDDEMGKIWAINKDTCTFGAGQDGGMDIRRGLKGLTWGVG